MTDSHELLGERYRVGKHIGRGGMADVYLGTDTRLGRTIAIKVLKADLVDDPQFRRRFQQEAQAVARMANRAIVRTYDTGEDTVIDPQGNERLAPYIIMEFVEGKLVKELVKTHALSISDSIAIATDVLGALEYSHRAGIIHRDIKPANIMVSLNGQVKVMDFGVARAVTDTSTTVADAAGVLGTAQYFSPEQARGELVDGRSDIYSTGVLLYEMLTGRPPFLGDSPASVAYQHVNEPPERPSAFNPEISQDLEKVVLTALQKNPDLRYQQPADFIRDLHLVSAGKPPLGGPKPAPVPAQPPADQATADDFDGKQFLDMAVEVEEEESPVAQIGKINKQVKPWVWITAALFAIIALAGLLWFASTEPLKSFSNNDTVLVPDVTGIDAAQATATLTDLGLVVNQLNEANEMVPEGEVLRTEPPAGIRLPLETTIDLYVSAGAEPTSVPNIQGLTLNRARDRLEDAGLELGLVTRENSGIIRAERVISTSPRIGAVIRKGEPVDLVISTGLTDVPDVTGLSLSDARAILSDSSLGVVVRTEARQECSGTASEIVDQTPEAGEIEQGETVTIAYRVINEALCQDDD